MGSYHGLVCERLDLLDGLGGTLLEGAAVQLGDTVSIRFLGRGRLSFFFSGSCVANQQFSGRRTLLWRWMVYSRATTCSRAPLPAGFFPLVVDDIAAKRVTGQIPNILSAGWKEGIRGVARLAYLLVCGCRTGAGCRIVRAR